MESFGINPDYLLLQIGCVILPVTIIVVIAALLFMNRKREE
jgi:hypothetical protein